MVFEFVHEILQLVVLFDLQLDILLLQLELGIQLLIFLEQILGLLDDEFVVVLVNLVVLVDSLVFEDLDLDLLLQIPELVPQLI